MSDLLDAVDALTKPQVTGVAQKNAAGRWIRVHEVKHDPLLTVIHDAVWPSGENNGGASTPANERLPLDSHMLYEYSKIASQIIGWAIEAGLRPTRNPIKDLEAWYVTTLADRNFDPSFRIGRLRGWEAHIRRLLAKSGKFTIEAPCPICGATAWGDMFNGGGLWPIKVEYVIEDDGRLTDHSALCQACRTVWEGHDSVTELADELNEKDEQTA
jgi:hypothetical protein